MPGLGSVAGCDQPTMGRRRCGKHYARLRRRDDFVTLSQPSIEQRFWAKVDSSAGGNSCWEWSGAQVSGYGYFHVAGVERVLAHRLAYELVNGELLLFEL